MVVKTVYVCYVDSMSWCQVGSCSLWNDAFNMQGRQWPISSIVKLYVILQCSSAVLSDVTQTVYTLLNADSNRTF